MAPWPLVPAVAAALLALLALKLRGPRGRGDLIAPPGRRKKRLSARDARRLTALVAEGKSGEARRRIRNAGYDDADARKLAGLIASLEALQAPAAPARQPGWSEAVRGKDGLTYGRGFDFNEALHEEDLRGKRGELDSKGE